MFLLLHINFIFFIKRAKQEDNSRRYLKKDLIGGRDLFRGHGARLLLPLFSFKRILDGQRGVSLWGQRGVEGGPVLFGVSGVWKSPPLFKSHRASLCCSRSSDRISKHWGEEQHEPLGWLSAAVTHINGTQWHTNITTPGLKGGGRSLVPDCCETNMLRKRKETLPLDVWRASHMFDWSQQRTPKESRVKRRRLPPFVQI